MKLPKHDIQKLEDYWINIAEYKKQLRHRERDLLEGWVEQDTNIGGGKANTVSDTTGNKATILADDLMYQNLKRIVNTIDTMYTELDKYQKTIVDMKYLAKKDGYEWSHVGDKLNMSVQRVLRIRNNLIDETAKRLGFV
jgi:RinA family phage transcriptional activator